MNATEHDNSQQSVIRLDNASNICDASLAQIGIIINFTLLDILERT